MTVIDLTDAETSRTAWTGFLRRRHRQLNSHYFGGRLAEAITRRAVELGLEQHEG
jgi:hypothetical protein